MNNYGYIVVIFMVWLLKHEQIIPWILEKCKIEE